MTPTQQGVSIAYTAPPTVGAFMRDDHFIRGVMGPFGSGKSTGCVMEMVFHRASEQKPGPDGIRRTRWAVIRNTYPELRDTTRKTFEEWVPASLCEWSEAEFSCVVRYNDVEAEFLFRALDRPEHVKKLLSLELTGAWVNEAREVEYTVIKMLLGRIGRFPAKRTGGPTWSGLIMDTNPPDDDSWWYRLFEEERPSEARLFKQPGGRTPEAENLENLRPGYYDTLASANASDPTWVKVHVDAQYGPTMSGKPIYPEYRDHVHCVDSIPVLPTQHALLLGMDFGLTPAMVFGQRDPRDGQVQIVDELVATDLGAVQFAENAARLIRSQYRGKKVAGFGDPAGEQRSSVDERTPYDVVNAQGIPIGPAPTNDFTLRREAVGRALTRLTLLGRPSLVISAKCRVLRKAMNGGYCFKRISAAGSSRFREVPDKNGFSHVAEALQYLMVGEGEDMTAIDGATERRRAKQPFKVKTNGARRTR